ncbi:MAG: ABC-2 transporter permease [Lachnospiraceae bacterium]|nr:ABC-2 transporter permease [Lachnospiraceae bacterium]
MKGLILKDIYCLRTRIMTYVLTLVAALAIGILISLSSEYGNLRMDVCIGEDPTVSEEDIEAHKMILGGATFLAILLPLGVGFDGIMTFHMDEKANFNDVLRTMPVKPVEIVLARFSTAYGFLLTGYVSSILIALLISPVVKVFTLGEMIHAGTVITCALAAGLGVTCCALFMWNKKICERIIIGVFLGVYAVFIIGTLALNKHYGDQLDAIMNTFMDKVKILFENCLVWLIPVALLMTGVCFFLSVLIVKRKGRGVR